MSTYLKKFSFKHTPALIKRDLKSLFSSKARAEKRAERMRLEANLAAQTASLNVTKSSPIKGKRLKTPVCGPIIHTSTSRATEPHSPSTDTTATTTTSTLSRSDSSEFAAPSTIATEYSSVANVNAPPTYDNAMSSLENWYKRHPASSIPESERWMNRGVIIILRIALRACFEDSYQCSLGFSFERYRLPYSPSALRKILQALTIDRQDALDMAGHLLSLLYSGFAQTARAFLKRIGFPGYGLTDGESDGLIYAFRKILHEYQELR